MIICILPGSGARKTRFSPSKDEETLETVKLSDLARETRVSTATVSRFVSARGGITPQTCDRIMDAGARLGFDLERGRKSRIIASVLQPPPVASLPFGCALGRARYCAERSRHAFSALSLSHGRRSQQGRAARSSAATQNCFRRDRGGDQIRGLCSTCSRPREYPGWR
jgi:hypothetical protein